MTFTDQARSAEIAWKQTSPLLPADARAPGMYRGLEREFCLPPDYARLNLLPGAEGALDTFVRAGIPWHDGVAGGPSNHLCSSQVQCVNALAPFALWPEALRDVFGSVLDIATVLPLRDPVALGHYVGFEWIGYDDPLGEWNGLAGTRGAHNTSADAAMRYVTSQGVEELALIEWKYTEQYQGSAGLSGSKTSQATRDLRYKHLFDDSTGPLRHDLVPYADLFVEPVYQLMRLQLLAWQFEKAGAAERVRVVLCAPAANTEYWASLNRPTHRQPGNHDSSDSVTVDDVGTLWRMMQRRPDRFILFDTAELVRSDSPTSDDFKARYDHLANPPDASAPNPYRSQQSRHRELVDELRSAVDRTRMILQRVAGDGGVLEQISEAEELLREAAPADVAELTARLNEVGELARRLRADSVPPILHLSP